MFASGYAVQNDCSLTQMGKLVGSLDQTLNPKDHRIIAIMILALIGPSRFSTGEGVK
jgi:hypothetical protein